MINLADYKDFLLFIGGLLVAGGAIYLVFHRRLRNIFISQAEVSRLQDLSRTQKRGISLPGSSGGPARTLNSEPAKNPSMPWRVDKILLAIIIGGFLVNQFLMFKFVEGGKITFGNFTLNLARKESTSLKLSPFDVVLARERMDKNNDGVCDTCGMPIDQCISTGQIDCNMGANKDAIGVLGSQHIHADFKVYVDGQALDFAKPNYYMKSSFLHVDDNQNKQDAGGVLHMHAKNVPLWLFFRSLGMKLDKDRLTLNDGKVYGNGDGNSLKFYLNGKKVDDLGNYVFRPLDKLLISYGPENDPNLQSQINSVTNYAKDHQQ